jgi:hypothetical protein
MDTDFFISLVDTVVRRGPDSDMIGFYTQMVQNFLNRNAHRRTASPYGDDKTGAEPTFVNAQTQFKGIIQQFLSA